MKDYCKSFEMRQWMGKSEDKRKAPLPPFPIIDQAFQRVGIDIVGPLRGKQYILTLVDFTVWYPVVDFTTWYPEAIVLASIEAPVVTDTLTKIFVQVGFLSEILTDRGGNFLAKVMECLWKCCGVKHFKTIAYYPQTNGLVERFSGTLKGMQSAYVHSHPNDWNEKLLHLLFAYREVPQETTTFSPFELMFGRQVRGPLDLVKEEWEGKISSSKTLGVEYLLSFHQKVVDMMKVVLGSLAQALDKQSVWYDNGAHSCTIDPGNKVMVSCH
ncbi:hypothetical protein Y1Q_0012685 [Alligator mississippiensis]|uniref:Integrase catalytic domain-containing protein n=1 Tax=Alligator mississippiensis TaxID=8496 RepID=A0A151M8K8_ALLMI|nr:hypothetical protein Y1Q_0012685 [Alligator mississippiensis]